MNSLLAMVDTGPYSYLAVLFLAFFSWGGAITGVAGESSGNWIHRTLQTDDGLPDNCVTGVAQSADGFLWVATRGGLLRFNGVEFTPMPLPGLPGVLNRVVHLMFLDSRGRMWMVMDRGPLVCLGPDEARSFGRAEGLPESRIAAITEDREGALWLACSDTLCRIKDGEILLFGKDEGLAGAGGNWVTRDERGDVWYAAGDRIGVIGESGPQERASVDGGPIRICGSAAGGLWVCAGTSLLYYREEGGAEARGNLPKNAEARSLFEDRTGVLWIGTAAHGLFRLAEGTLERVATSHPEVDCLTEDHEGNIWVGTNGGGLNQIRPRAVSLIGRSAGLPAESVRSVAEDAQGAVWVVMQNGSLMILRDGEWKEFGAEEGWKWGAATCVASAPDGVWVGTRTRGLVFLQDGTGDLWHRRRGLASNSIRSLLVAQNGDVWVATDSPIRLQRLRDGVLRTMGEPMDVRLIRAMAEGVDGTIWIATSEGEIMRASGDSLVSETARQKRRNPMSIRSLHVTPDGALWIGYAGFGVGRLKDGEFARMTIAQGLRDDYASQICDDGRGGMWIAGNLGLSQVILSEITDVAEQRAGRVRSRVFGRSHGLVGLQPSFDCHPSVARTRDGRLLFATRGGLLVVEPGRIDDNIEPPPVVLESVSVDDQTLLRYDNRLSLGAGAGELLGERELRLPPGHNKLEFAFAALSFASPENIHFRYQLSNFDKKWIEARTQFSASYPRLPAGDYEFHVVACNNAGVWNEAGARIRFVVAPFFWQTWWFRALAVTLFTAGVIGSVRYISFRRLRERMGKLQQQASLHKERARIARDMHDEVGAKLTRLSLLSDMASSQPELTATARSDVREISETARETILAFEEIVWAVNPHNDTLGDLAHYLCRHAEEFFEGSSIQCVFDLPKDMKPLMLPTEVRHQVFLAAKEALNNVMKHAAASQVSLQFILQPAAFEVFIHDDGCGFDPAAPPKRAGGGNGLANMRERLRSIDGRFECNAQPGHGTHVTFRVPLA